MNFLTLQDNVRALIAAHATFAPVADTAVFADLGFSASDMESSLDFDEGNGYAIAVWPPFKGQADPEYSGAVGVNSMIVVRIEVNPKLLEKAMADKVADDSKPTASEFLAGMIKDICDAVLGQGPEVGGQQFSLAPEALEMASFDEGCIAYHIRFIRLAVFS
jgi:hypothetical protein